MPSHDYPLPTLVPDPFYTTFYRDGEFDQDETETVQEPIPTDWTENGTEGTHQRKRRDATEEEQEEPQEPQYGSYKRYRPRYNYGRSRPRYGYHHGYLPHHYLTGPTLASLFSQNPYYKASYLGHQYYSHLNDPDRTIYFG